MKFLFHTLALVTSHCGEESNSERQQQNGVRRRPIAIEKKNSITASLSTHADRRPLSEPRQCNK